MITKQLTKTQFVVEILNRDVQSIYRAQLLSAKHNITLRGDDLKQRKHRTKKTGDRADTIISALSSPDYSIVGNNGMFQLSATIPLVTRFADMKSKGNWMVYNKPIWGILYKQTKAHLKYGYGSELYDFVGKSLDRAFESTKK